MRWDRCTAAVRERTRSSRKVFASFRLEGGGMDVQVIAKPPLAHPKL